MRSSNFSVSEPGKDDNERVVARSGGGGPGDLTDGVIRNATNTISVSYASGGGPGDLADGGICSATEEVLACGNDGKEIPARALALGLAKLNKDFSPPS